MLVENRLSCIKRPREKPAPTSFSFKRWHHSISNTTTTTNTNTNTNTQKKQVLIPKENNHIRHIPLILLASQVVFVKSIWRQISPAQS